MKNNKKLVQAWISNEQHNELVKLAKDLRRSKTSLVEDAIKQYIYHWGMPSSSHVRELYKNFPLMTIDGASDGKNDYTVVTSKSIVDQYLKKNKDD